MHSFIDHKGVERFLGNNPAPLRLSWPLAGSTPEVPLVDRSEWDALIGDDLDWKNPFVINTENQKSVGQCNACATTSAVATQRMKQGFPYVQLSAADLYKRINGGWDRGSTLEDGIAEAFNGVCTTKECEYTDWRSRPTAQALEVRKSYKLLEAYLCPTFAHCMSAVLKGFDLITGIMWYNNYNPDKDGWLPRGSGGAGGHAIHGHKPTKRDSVYGIWHKQSWGDWHPSTDNSFVIPEVAYDKSIGGWWAVRSVTRESSDLPLPEFLKG